MRQRGVNCSQWTSSTIEYPYQQDGTSCGVCKAIVLVMLCMHYSIFLTCFSPKQLAECVLEEEAIFDTDEQGVLAIQMGIAKKL